MSNTIIGLHPCFPWIEEFIRVTHCLAIFSIWLDKYLSILFAMLVFIPGSIFQVILALCMLMMALCLLKTSPNYPG